MGWFSKSSANAIDWTVLNRIEDLNQLLEDSNDKPIMIFKHSTRCSISSMAKSRLENDWDLQEEVTPVYLDLISYREISNEIADRLKVMHQSPQIILVKNGLVVHHASHNQISVSDVKTHLK